MATATINGVSYIQRDVYLSFSIIGFFLSIAIYVIYLTNFNNHNKLEAIPLILIVIKYFYFIIISKIF